MRQLPERGRSVDEVLAELDRYKALDLPTEGGRSFTNDYHDTAEAIAVAEAAYTRFLWENALDITAVRSLPAFERELTAMVASHLRAPQGAAGSFTSGGTESLILAVKAARDHAAATRGVTEPEIVLPVSAHPAFFKAAHLLDVTPVRTPVDPVTFRADVDAVADALTDRTVLVVGSAAGYGFGVVDPITELASVAAERGVLCHVDGCIGGWLLPWFAELGADVPPWDFTVPGVTSISVDLHKYALCAKGASVVVYRDVDVRRHQFFSFTDWPGYAVVNTTIQSSKTGGPLAAAWAVLNQVGADGYRDLAARLLEGTRKVIGHVEAIDGLRVLGAPELCLVAVAADETAGDPVDVFRVAGALERKGWHHFPQFSGHGIPRSLHVTVLPDNAPHIDEWAADLAAAVEEVRTTPAPTGLADVRGALDELDLGSIDYPELAGLLELAGIGPDTVNDGDLAEVNDLLDALPAPVRDKVLTLFLDLLTRPAD